MDRNENKAAAAIQTGAAIVEWKLHGTRHTPDELRAKLALHGFDSGIVPNIDQTVQVKSAGAKWTQGKGNADRYRSEIGGTDADNIFIGVLKRRSDGTNRKAYDQVATLVWSKHSDSWENTTVNLVDHNGAQLPHAQHALHCNAAAACKKWVDNFRLYHDHSFIRPVLIQAPLKAMGAIKFCHGSSGGAQIVPITQWDNLQRLRGFVRSLGDSTMAAIKVDASDPATMADMVESVRDHLSGNITRVRGEIAEWRDKSKRLNSGSIGARMGEFKDLRAQAAMYAQCLQLRVDDLLAELTEAEGEAKTLLDRAMGREPAPAEPRTAPTRDGVVTGPVQASA